MLNLLPSDLFCRSVASYLAGTDLGALACVNKRFKALLQSSSSAWEEVFSREFPFHRFWQMRENHQLASVSVDWKRLYCTLDNSIQLFNRDPEIWEQYIFENFLERPLPKYADDDIKDEEDAEGTNAGDVLPVVSTAAPEQQSSDGTQHARTIGRFLFRNIARLDREKLTDYLCIYPNRFTYVFTNTRAAN